MSIHAGNPKLPGSEAIETGETGCRAVEPLALSLLNDFLYCPRRAALKIIEGWRSGNVHTERGDIVHEHTDLCGYEVVKGVTFLRALPVFSDRLGLNGKCDIVEQRPDGSLFPVEFKVGRRRQFVNDDVQLCAQALCLEEMFRVTVPRGAIFHADSKRRREVEFTTALRARTLQTVAEVRALLDSNEVAPIKRAASDGATLENLWQPLPSAGYVEGRCEECSLYEVCLPQLTQPTAASTLKVEVSRLYQT